MYGESNMETSFFFLKLFLHSYFLSKEGINSLGEAWCAIRRALSLELV